MPPSVRHNLQFGLLQSFYWAGVCVSFSYFTSYFAAMGCSDLMIGVLSTVSMVGSFIAQPLIGRLCDRCTRVKPLLLLLTTLSAAFSLLLWTGRQPLAVTFIGVFFMSACFKLLTNVIDMWTMRSTMLGMRLDFGFTRGMGSACYAVVGLGFGRLVARYGPTLLVPAFLLCAAGMCVVVCWIRETPVCPRQRRGKKAGVGLLKNRDYLIFVASLFLVNMGSTPTYGYLPRKFAELGANDAMYGFSLFLSALSEVPVLWIAKDLRRRFAPRRMLMVAFSGYVLKLLCTALAPTPVLLAAAQGLGMISGGFLFAFSVQYVAQIVEPDSLFSAQTLMGAWATGVSGMAGNLLAGVLATQLGLSEMYWAALLPALAGWILFCIPFPHKQNATLVDKP